MKSKQKPKMQAKAKTRTQMEETTKTNMKTKPTEKTKVRVVNRISPPRVPSVADERRMARAARAPQFAYMKAPGIAHNFEVGDSVEVYCDHEKNKERVRGWIRGIVVQVDNKMVAVQFRSNVFLTDGWMVPDRILWYPLNSEHIRSAAKKSRKAEKAIPEY